MEALGLRYERPVQNYGLDVVLYFKGEKIQFCVLYTERGDDMLVLISRPGVVADIKNGEWYFMNHMLNKYNGFTASKVMEMSPPERVVDDVDYAKILANRVRVNFNLLVSLLKDDGFMSDVNTYG